MGTESIISLSEAVRRLGIHIDLNDGPLVDTNRKTADIMCPMCSPQHRTKRRTLNLDFAKNVFGCNLCDFRGGVYKFIAAYTHWPYSEVVERVKAGQLGSFTPTSIISDKAENDLSDDSNVHAPIRVKNETYNKMLSFMTLSEKHRSDLRGRGLSDEDIDRIGFKSLRRTIDSLGMENRLSTSGYKLEGVPGFCIAKSGKWTLSKVVDDGFLIPLRNAYGMIQGFQVRYDHPSDDRHIPKYGYLSSKNYTGGTACQPWINWAGEDYTDRIAKVGEAKKQNVQVGHFDPFDVILIEGPLKAYIVNAITGVNVIAVPGVNALKNVPQVVRELKSIGMRKIYIAYDMDAATNKEVAKQLDRLRSMLDDAGYEHSTLQWDSTYKGLDDYVTSEPFMAMRKKFIEGKGRGC